MSTTPPTPENPQEPEPRYGVRLPEGQVPPQQGYQAQPTDNARPGWDTAPGSQGDIPVQPSGVYSNQPGYPAQGGYPGQPGVGQSPYGAQPGQPGYGAPGYGAQVYGAQYTGFGGPVQVPERPLPVLIASILLWVGAAAYAALGVFPLFNMDPDLVRQLVLEQMAATSPEQAAQFETMLTPDAFRSSLVMAGVLMIAVCVFAAVVAWLTLRGSNAWRIVGTVCGSIAAVLNLISGGAYLLFGLAAVAIIVLWWVRPSSEWFRAKRAAKLQGQRQIG